jgi:DNA-binding NarL/FixJ family response regulator
MIEIRLREADARILVEALRSYLVDRRHTAAETGTREVSRGLQVKRKVLESILRTLTGSARGAARSLAREGNTVFESKRAPRTGRLTERQREVLRLVAEGRSTKQIARILTVSIKTGEFHRARIMETLGIRTIAELTRYALAHGIAAP